MNTTQQRSGTDVSGSRSERHPFARPLEHCPACGSAQLEPVTEHDTGQVHFLCGNCGKCWHVELGFVRSVTTEWCRG